MPTKPDNAAQLALAPNLGKYRPGRARRELDVAVKAARAAGTITTEDAGLVGLARTLADAFDVAGPERGIGFAADDVADLAHQLRMTMRDLGMGPNERAKRDGIGATDPLERLFAGLDSPTG